MSILILAAAAMQAVPPQQGPLEWLVRDWSCRVEMPGSGPFRRFLEIRRDGGGLTGRLGIRRGRNQVPHYEASLRITGRGADTRLVYTRLDGTAVAYRQTVSGHEGVTFESRAGGATRRISFRNEPLQMILVISGGEGGAAAITRFRPPTGWRGGAGCDGRN